MTRNTHDRVHDHHGSDLDTNIIISGDSLATSSGESLHDAIGDIESWALASFSGGGGPVAIAFVFDGDGTAIPTGGPKCVLAIPFACAVTEWQVESADGISTTTTFDVKKRAYGGGAAASMIGAGTKPFISAGTENKAAPSSWTTTAISAGDKLYPHLDANNNGELLTLTLTVTRA